MMLPEGLSWTQLLHLEARRACLVFQHLCLPAKGETIHPHRPSPRAGARARALQQGSGAHCIEVSASRMAAPRTRNIVVTSCNHYQ